MRTSREDTALQKVPWRYQLQWVCTTFPFSGPHLGHHFTHRTSFKCLFTQGSSHSAPGTLCYTSLNTTVQELSNVPQLSRDWAKEQNLQTSQTHHLSKLALGNRETVGSGVMSTYCFCKGPELGSQHPYQTITACNSNSNRADASEGTNSCAHTMHKGHTRIHIV